MRKRLEKPRHRPYDRAEHKHDTHLLLAEETGAEGTPVDGHGSAEARTMSLFAVSSAEWAQWQAAHRTGQP